MSSVDNRIVNMQFNNKQFEAGAASSSKALTDLEKTISSTGSSGGLDEMGAAVDTVASHFGALEVAGVAALATIASTATSTALSMGRDLLGSITSTIFGAGAQRALDIQQAKFQFRGLGLDVAEVMQNATDAVTGTAFGLQDAATLATQFGGAGIKAGDDMTQALRATAGIAAQTGTSFSEIGQIMGGIAGIGKLNTQDLIQFGVRGLDVTGALGDELGKTQQQIRQMVSDGQINFATFSKAMDDAFGKNATKANRTFTGAMANMKAALSRIGADFFEGQLKPAGDILNALGDAFDKVRTAMGPVSKDFGKVSEGISSSVVKFLDSLRVVRLIGPVIAGFKNIVAPFVAIAKAVGEAWLTVFPHEEHQSRRTIFTLAKAFEYLTIPLQLLAKAISFLTPLFVVFFEVIRIGFVAISGLATLIGNLFSKITGIGGSISDGILQGLDPASIEKAIVDLANNIIKWIKDVLGIHSPAESMIEIGTNIIQGIVDGLQAAVGFLWNALGLLATGIIEGLGNALSHLKAGDIAALINAALVGGILLAIRSVIKTIGSFASSLQKISTNLTKPFDLLTQSLQVMQTQVRAELIKSIAIAVGILTVSLIALSLMPFDKLKKGLGFLASELGLIIGTMAALGKINPESIVASGAAIVLISGAMVLLTVALAGLALIPSDQIAKALTTMAISLTLMVGAVEFLGTLGPSALAGAGSIVLVAAAMVALAAAVGAFALIPADQVGKALTTMAVSLVLVVAAIAGLGSIGPAALAGAGSIFIVAEAMIVLAAAVFAFSKINPNEASKALVTMAVALGEIVLALALTTAIGPEVIASAGAIIIMAFAMKILADAIAVISEVGPEKASQALVTMAVALGIFLAAAAIAAIGPVSVGLGVLALSMLVFGAGVALLGAGLLAAATGFSIFVAIFSAGTGVLLTGLGALLTLLPELAKQLAISIVVFIETIAKMAPRLRDAFGKIIKSMLGVIQDAIPHLKDLANKLIGALLDVITKNIPKYEKLIEALIRAGLKVIEMLVPLYVRTGANIVVAVLEGLAQKLPKMIDAGTDLIVAFIKGIEQSGERIIRAAGNAVVKFVQALPPQIRKNSEDLAKAGVDIGLAIVEGITSGLLDKGVDMVESAVEELVSHIPGPVRTFLGLASPSKMARHWGEMIVAGLVLGITDNIKNAVGAAIQLANAVISSGNKAIADAQKQSRRQQIAAEKKQARADFANRFAKAAEKEARQSPKNKALQQAAKKARDRADQQQKAADEAQRKADAAAQKVSDTQAFEDADKQGKGDILTGRAEDLASKAVKKLAEANAAAAAAKKATGHERDRLKREAKQDAAAAKRLADQSKADQKRATVFFADAVKARIKSINEQRKADEQQRREQEKFDTATDEQKIEILQNRAEAAQKRSKAAQKQSEALVKQARKIAKKDADRAQKLLDQAERLAQKAQDSADEAKQAQQDADSLANQGTTDTGGGPPLQLSTSALEDAAAAIDRYTKSLQQAEEAAQATEPVLQFVQYNNSPEALSDATVYRQTKNLLSTAEIKMAANSTP